MPNGKGKTKKPKRKSAPVGKRPTNSGQRKLVVPAARGFATTATRPVISQSSDGLRIKHREYFWTTVSGLGASFTTWRPGNNVGASDALLRINPSNEFVFPWLSNISRCYERYTFKHLTFGYMPRCSTSTTGTVMIAIETDPEDQHPATEQVMLSYKGAVDGPVWSELKCTYKTPDLHGSYVKKYTSDRPPTTGARSTDCGFILYYGDGPANVGKFYVDYDISFYTPQLPAAGVTGVALVVDDGAATATESVGVNPVVTDFGMSLFKDAVAYNKWHLPDALVGNIVTIVADYFMPSSQTLPGATSWVATGMSLLSGDVPIAALANELRSISTTWRVTSPQPSVTLPVTTTGPTHSNIKWSTFPYSSSHIH